MDTIDNLATRLLARRQALGLSQVEAAGQLGVSFPTYNSWERGRHAPKNQAILRSVELWLDGDGEQQK